VVIDVVIDELEGFTRGEKARAWFDKPGGVPASSL
jgi:hypothetical protein